MHEPTWHWIRALRDGAYTGARDEPGLARRYLARLDHPPPCEVADDEIGDLMASVIKAFAADPQKTIPPGLASDAQLQDQIAKIRRSGGKGLAGAARDLGTHNPKGVDAKANGVGILPEPTALGPSPDGVVHGGNTELAKPYAGVVGDAARSAGYKLLTFAFRDTAGRLRQVVDEIGDAASPVRQALIDLGLDGDSLDAAAATHAERCAGGAMPGEPNPRHKQVQFPLGDGSYHAVTPVPNSGLHRELIDRIGRRGQWHGPQEARVREWFPRRDMAVGGTKAQNAGLLAAWMTAMPALLAEPPTETGAPAPDIVEALERSATLFPDWIVRRIRRDGVAGQLARAVAAEAERLNERTRRAVDDAVDSVAAEMAQLALRVHRLPDASLARALAALPPEERALYERRLRALDASERPPLAEVTDAAEVGAERALEALRSLDEPTIDRALASRLRKALARQLEVVT